MKKVGSIRNVVLASAVLLPVLGFSVIASAQHENENEAKGSFSFSSSPPP